MATVTAPPPSTDQPLPKRPVCRFVIIYEDFLAVERAEVFCEKLIRKLSLDTSCLREAWSFQLLRQFPNIARITAEEAADHADFIILSLDGFAELPAHVRAWLGIWGKGACGQKHAFIALFNKLNEGEGALVSTQAYLHRFTNGLRE